MRHTHISHPDEGNAYSRNSTVTVSAGSAANQTPRADQRMNKHSPNPKYRFPWRYFTDIETELGES